MIYWTRFLIFLCEYCCFPLQKCPKTDCVISFDILTDWAQYSVHCWSEDVWRGDGCLDACAGSHYPTVCQVRATSIILCQSRFEERELTHLPLVPHMYVSRNWVSIGSVNGLLPVQHQAITLSNADLLLLGPFGTNLNKIWIEIQNFSFIKNVFQDIVCKMTAILSRGDELSSSAIISSSHMKDHNLVLISDML